MDLGLRHAKYSDPNPNPSSLTLTRTLNPNPNPNRNPNPNPNLNPQARALAEGIEGGPRTIDSSTGCGYSAVWDNSRSCCWEC
eukprot:464099-Amorphochlora_amoeboformis.AAC.1